MVNFQTELLVGIIIAVVGYILTYLNNNKIHRREKKLSLIDTRLEKLYGPLHILSVATKTAIKALEEKVGLSRDEIWASDDENILNEYRHWIQNIFEPINSKKAAAIYDYGFLSVEEQTPKYFDAFVTHFESLNAIIKTWEKGDYSATFPLIKYPSGFDEYLEKRYLALKREQLKLIGQIS